MATAFYLLLFIAHLGAFDVVYFHHLRCRLHERPECQHEVLLHTARHLVYGLQFLWVANLRFHGAALLLLALLYGADVFIAWSDVWEETASRKLLGGLPRGEYLMHVVLTLLVGVYLTVLAGAVWSERTAPTAIVWDPPPVPPLLRLYMSGMGLSALGLFVHDLWRWLGRWKRTRAAAAAIR